MFAFPLIVSSQTQQYFENPLIFDESKGINVGSISSVVADKNGFLWIAGSNGLQRFDGHYFKQYSHDPKDSLSLPAKKLYHLFYEKEKHQLWISSWESGRGLIIFDLTTEKFKHHAPNLNIPGQISGHGLIWTYKDKFNNIWTSVTKKGLVKYLPESETFQPFIYQPTSAEARFNFNQINEFQCMSQDKFNDSILWMGSGAGLVKFNVVSGQFRRYSIIPGNIEGYITRSVLHHENNQVYVGTWGMGLFRFDPQTERFSKCDLGVQAKPGTPSYNIRLITPKSKTQLWLTFSSGMSTYDIPQNQVTTSRLNNLSQNKLYGALYTDKKGRIITWKNNRLFIYDPIRQQIKPYYKLSRNPAYQFIVRRILEDKETENLWLAAQSSEGLYRLNLKTQTWEVFPPPKDYFDQRVNFNCWDVLKTRNGELLILEANTIYLLDEKSKKLIPWEIQPKVKGAFFKRMIEDSQGNIWIGSQYEGVFKINPTDKTIHQYKQELTEAEKSDPGAVWDLLEDRNGNIWIRCQGYSVYDKKRDTFFNFPYFFHDKKIVYHIESLGLDGEGNVLVASHEQAIGITDAGHPEKGVVKYFDKSSGLETHMPARLLLDKDKNVWITSLALEKTDLNNSTYYRSDYLLEKDFESISQLSDGRIAVGFRSGIGIFHPDSLIINGTPPLPYVRSFKVFDKDLTTKLPLYQTRDIYLDPWQNFFSLEISALNPSFDGESEFLYQLEGVDPDWVNPGNRHYVAYTDIGSGIYRFKLKAKSKEGIWNETPYELRIHIATPWYKSWWAYILATILFLGIAFYLYRFQLSKKLAQQEAHRLKELDTFKTRFYANITHEFRTPLTVIQGMVDELENQPKKESKKKLRLIRRNNQSLLRLVNQMLDLSKLQAGKVIPNFKQNDILMFLHYLVEAHESLANLQKISLQFYSEEKKIIMDFDAKKLESIITNLISNAIKFTPAYGKILVVVQKIKVSRKPYLKVIIKDTGIGISAAEMPFIFNRFHQANPSNEYQGSGIGLALVKELIDTMKGTIEVESEEGKGTIFTLLLPIQNNAPFVSLDNLYSVDIPSPIIDLQELKTDQIVNENELPVLLIIEDNLDVTYYLKACLEDQYKIFTAKNGKKGIEKALEVLPDLIISDVMMPEKDGFEVCATLKEDERSSHIPIILLTAKSTLEDKVSGLKQGADAYLTKPFEKAELIVRIDKLMEIRRTLQKKYSRPLLGQHREKDVTKNKESIFITKFEKAILDHLEDENFSIDELGEALAMSRSQIHRKIKALTGKSTSIYIRLVRLEKAKELLTTKDLSISEIAYQVGFKSPVYFSQVFKETFGESPSAFSKK